MMAAIGLVVASAGPVRAQTEADVALRFFQAGGAYCVRLAPEGTDLSEEAAWTVMMLTSSGSKKNALRIRDVDAGTSGLRGPELTEVGLIVTSVWRRDRVREEFFDRFAAAITDGSVRARLVTLTPPGLTAMTPRQRAELYLKFSERGTRVDFEKIADMPPDEFLRFRTYVPD
jgi:hypothetical protein